MVLITPDKELEEICEDLESRVKNIEELSDIIVKVKIVENFSNKAIGILIPDNPAAYWRESNEIQLSTNILELSYDVKVAIIMHEVGEAFVEKNNLPKLKNEQLPIAINLPKDILVDRLVCKWGFKNEIVQSRRTSSYGEVYAENLENWEDKDKYIEQMTRWYLKRNSGN